MSKNGLLLVLLQVFVGCATKPASLNHSTLEQLGVTKSPPAAIYPFEEFYKTGQIFNLDFKHDKSGLYFLKKDKKVQNVFAYDLKSKKITQVTHYPETVSTFLVDPNGKFLVIQKDKGGSEIFDLYRFDLKTRRTTSLTDGRNVERSYLCDITRDGSKIYFSQSRGKREEYDIKAYDFKTQKAQIVLAAKKEQLYCERLNRSDTQLVFTRFIDNNELHLGLFDLRTAQVKYVLADKGIKNSSAAFANSDKELFFLSTKDSDILRLWQYDLASGKVQLTKTELNTAFDGIAVFANSRVSAVQYRGDLAPKVKIYDGVFEREKRLPFPAEQIKSAYFHRDDPNLGVLVVQEGAAPKKFYLLSGDKVELFYDSNQSAIKSADFSKSHSLFVTSFDGTPIPTHYFIPNGTSAKNKKPVAFWIHGGPEDHVDPEFTSVIQFIVNQGFVVVAPNVRGSTGFGKKYQFMDNGDWGGAHIKDIVSVAEFTKELDFVDRNNVFILGGSFGGFSVMSLITQYPNVFKAAVNIFGITELSSFMEAWPVQAQSYWMGELGFDPRKDKAQNEKVSPLFHLDQIAIPLQVHQGANDIRVPKSQSDALLAKLKQAGKTVEYFVYDDEGHGFTKFKNSKACFTRITEFFRRQITEPSLPQK